VLSELIQVVILPGRPGPRPAVRPAVEHQCGLLRWKIGPASWSEDATTSAATALALRRHWPALRLTALAIAGCGGSAAVPGQLARPSAEQCRWATTAADEFGAEAALYQRHRQCQPGNRRRPGRWEPASRHRDQRSRGHQRRAGRCAHLTLRDHGIGTTRAAPPQESAWRLGLRSRRGALAQARNARSRAAVPSRCSATARRAAAASPARTATTIAVCWPAV
jgi:hypothetical protein